MIDAIAGPGAAGSTDMDERHRVLRSLSRELEANFLAEMLKSAGINKTESAFGGGAGEDAFSSMLTQEYAKKMSASGGIGLAEQIFKSLVEQERAS